MSSVKIVDARAAELNVKRGDSRASRRMKALAMGASVRALRNSHALSGWRREEIGTRLLEAMPLSAHARCR